MHSTQFTTTLSIDEIKNRLSPLDNFKIEEESKDLMSAKVGSLFKYKRIGVFLTDDYQAPMNIDVQEGADENSPTTVQLSPRSKEIVDTKKATEFYDRGYAEIRELLEA